MWIKWAMTPLGMVGAGLAIAICCELVGGMGLLGLVRGRKLEIGWHRGDLRENQAYISKSWA